MSLPLPLTRKQPEHWPRKRIDACFSIHQNISGNPLQFEPGDVVVRIHQGKMAATVATQAQEETTRGVARMRGNGLLLPELMALMINHPDIQQSMHSTADRGGFSSAFSLNVRSLGGLLIALPDPQTQVLMAETITHSHRYLSEHAGHLRKQAEIMDRMANAILHQVLLGKTDRKEVLGWVGQAMMPWLRMGPGRIEGVKDYGIAETAQAEPGTRFVRMDEHQEHVAQLQARIRKLEAAQAPPATEADAATPERASARRASP